MAQPLTVHRSNVPHSVPEVVRLRRPNVTVARWLCKGAVNRSAVGPATCNCQHLQACNVTDLIINVMPRRMCLPA